jgi:hypothetical protein
MKPELESFHRDGHVSFQTQPYRIEHGLESSAARSLTIRPSDTLQVGKQIPSLRR